MKEVTLLRMKRAMDVSLWQVLDDSARAGRHQQQEKSGNFHSGSVADRRRGCAAGRLLPGEPSS